MFAVNPTEDIEFGLGKEALTSARVHASSVAELAVPPAFLANALIQYLVLGNSVVGTGTNVELFVDTNIPESSMSDPLFVVAALADRENLLCPEVITDAVFPLDPRDTVTSVENSTSAEVPVPTEFIANDLKT